MNFLEWLYEAHVTIGGHDIAWREIIGNGFGFASAIGGLRRRVWAWPVGIVGNVLLFTVFIAATFDAQAQQPLFGQAGRQVFFIITSIYGWWRWNEHKKARHDSSGHAITPRWATARERTAYLLAAAGGVVHPGWDPITGKGRSGCRRRRGSESVGERERTTSHGLRGYERRRRLRRSHRALRQHRPTPDDGCRAG